MVPNSFDCIKILNFIFEYYSAVLCCPFVYLSIPFLKRKITTNYSKLCCYLFARLLQIVNAIQLLRLIVRSVWSLHVTGNIDVFELSGMFLWLTGMNTVLIGDYLFCDTEVNFKIKKVVHLFTQIWNQFKSNKLATREINSEIVRRLLLLFVHNAATDFFSVYNFATTLYGNLDQDPTLLYTTAPWKTKFVDTVYWICININVMVLVFMWSAMLVVPSALAYNIEACIRLLDCELKSARTYIEIKRVLDAYSQLIYCTNNRLVTKIGRLNLAFYLIAGFQQFVESYFLFQLIQSGATWDDYQVLLVDIGVSFNVYGQINS